MTTYNSPWMRKPLHAVYHQNEQQQQQQQQHRHLSVWDLIGIGVGGTVGSGIFVLTGQIASQYAGTYTWCSFALSGVAATCSGVCFAELAGRIPAAGSSYAYAYACWGQLAAVVAAACLTLEYGIAGAAVARSWGEKVVWIVGNDDDDNNDIPSPNSWLISGGMNIPAFLISAASTVLLMVGVKESKHAMNFITILKMLLVMFMIGMGFWLTYTKEDDLSDNNDRRSLIPISTAGIVRGATSSFFGYLGYDEVCCVAGEAKHPVRDMPRAVLGTLALVTATYIAASVALTGMVDDTSLISPTAGFPSAFRLRNVEWAAEIAAWGEIITLPVVVLISLLAQPRLTFGMAQDGLLPAIFAQTDIHGNLVAGTLIQGTIMTFIAAFVPFYHLNDLISAGILVAFSLTDASLVVVRRESPPTNPGLLEQCLVGYNVLCFITALLITNKDMFGIQSAVAAISALATVGTFAYMTIHCPPSARFGGNILQQWMTLNDNDDVMNSTTTDQHRHPESDYFQTPWVPFVPCLGMAVNWYLIAQLEVFGLFLLGLYLGVVVLLYLTCCRGRSAPSWAHPTNRHDRADYQFVGESKSPTSSAGSEDAISLTGLNHNFVDKENASSIIYKQDEDIIFSTGLVFTKTNY